MKELKKQLVMRWDEILAVFGLQVFAFLFGEVIIAAVVHFSGEDTIFELGTMMTLMGVMILMVIFGMTVTEICFNIGIGMGGVRKRLVPAIYLVTFLETFLAYFVAYFFHQLELWIFRTFYSGMNNEIDFGFLFQWNYILAICLAMTAVRAFLGMLFVRYGKVAFWIFWMLWIVVCVGIPRGKEVWKRCQDTVVVRGIDSFLDAIGKITENTILWGITGISVFLLFLSYFLLRRQQVRS